MLRPMSETPIRKMDVILEENEGQLSIITLGITLGSLMHVTH
jgi:hypothetical protein